MTTNIPPPSPLRNLQIQSLSVIFFFFFPFPNHMGPGASHNLVTRAANQQRARAPLSARDHWSESLIFDMSGINYSANSTKHAEGEGDGKTLTCYRCLFHSRHRAREVSQIGGRKKGRGMVGVGFLRGDTACKTCPVQCSSCYKLGPNCSTGHH